MTNSAPNNTHFSFNPELADEIVPALSDILEQFPAELRGEVKLIIAVLWRALLDIQPTTITRRKDRIRALAWLSEEDSDHPEPYSFRWICECLGLEPETFAPQNIRRKIVKDEKITRTRLRG